MFDYWTPPPQCDYEPSGYRITWLPSRSTFCGISYNPLSQACSNPKSKRIWIKSGLPPEVTARLLQHEKGHINCEWWRHPWD